MDIQDLRRVIAVASPVGITRDNQVTYSYQSFLDSAALQNLSLPSKSETFGLLRDLGFSDAKSNDELRIAASLRTVLLISYPVWQQVERQLIALSESEASSK